MIQEGQNIINSLTQAELRRRQTIRIEPTQHDCDISMPGKSTQCMYATALRRMFPTALRAQVDMHGATVTDKAKYWRYNMTKKGANKLLKFDGGELAPGEDIGVTLTLVGVRLTSGVSPERQEQINEARRSRAARGKPDRQYKKSLRLRVQHKKIANGVA